MNRISRRAALAAALALGASPAFGAGIAPGPDDMTWGDPKARVKIVEYASLSCPHCAHFNEEVMPTIKAKYIDTGKASYTLKEMLTPPAPVAMAGFLLARCAGPSKYFNVVDQVFRSQARWENAKIKPLFVEIALANGLTQAQFDACLSDEKTQAALSERVRKATEDDGVDSTPTVFVNGKLVASPTLPELEAAIAAAGKGRR